MKTHDNLWKKTMKTYYQVLKLIKIHASDKIGDPDGIRDHDLQWL